MTSEEAFSAALCFIWWQAVTKRFNLADDGTENGLLFLSNASKRSQRLRQRAHTHISHRMLIWQPHNKQERFEPRRHISHSSALEYSTVNTRKERFELFRTTKRHKRLLEKLRETDMETEKRHRHTPEQQLCSQRSVCSIIHLQGFRDRK